MPVAFPTDAPCAGQRVLAAKMLNRIITVIGVN
jgi:hypothetical protein